MKTHLRKPAAALLALAAISTMSFRAARADIFQWEYINPADPAQGTRASSMLCPDGAGVSATQNSNFFGLDLYRAYFVAANLQSFAFDSTILIDADMSHAQMACDYCYHTKFDGANFTQANLSGGYFYGATFSGANLSGAIVHNATFDRDPNTPAGGITPSQLYATASYQSHDLTSLSLGGNSLAGIDLSGQNLTSAGFYRAELTAANFSNASLVSASFYLADLTGADFTDANVRGANFERDASVSGSNGISVAQLSSTASFKAHDLSGIDLGHNSLAGGDFSGQILSDTHLGGADFTGASFAHADLTAAYFASAAVAGANFSGAYLRNANFARDVATGIGGLTPSQITSTASYAAHDLSGISLSNNLLASLSFAGQNLTGAYLFGANLAGCDFTGATITQATFDNTIGFTKGQLYTTTNYTQHDLHALGLSNLNFSGANFRDQNVSSALFTQSDLTAADFTRANLSSAVMSEAKLAGANFAQANLTSAYLYGADLTGANFTGANIQSAIFLFDSATGVGGLTLPQLYSTSSYANRNLDNVHFGSSNFAGANFAGQNLKNAAFWQTNLTGADFRHATMHNTSFSGAVLTGADFSAADMRGAFSLDLTGLAVENTIRPDGHIHGFNLSAGQFLEVHNFFQNHFIAFPLPVTGPVVDVPAADGPILLRSNQQGSASIINDAVYLPPIWFNSPFPIVVDQQMQMGPGGVLRLVFDFSQWNSPISFQAGIPIALGGELDLEFDPTVDAATQIGRTIHLFDWTGVMPTGTFTVDGPYIWDVSKLYATGDVTLTAVPEPAAIELACLGIAGATVLPTLRARRPT